MQPDFRQPTHVLLALTGASAMPYACRLLECLINADCTVDVIISDAARVVLTQEMAWDLPDSSHAILQFLCAKYHVSHPKLRVFDIQDWFAPCASGSNAPDAMIICPASMGVIAAVAHGLSDNLIERAADVCLKEKRPLLLVPRESPLSTLHLKNLLTLSEYGATIIPPLPAFYHHPQTINDIVDFTIARILDHLHIEHLLHKRWG